MAIYLIMGVAGCGKTTVGQALALELGCPFLEGDQFHPAANTAKMRTGIPLTDEDRWPWLEMVGKAVHFVGDPVVFSCSALKESYRARLSEQIGTFQTVFLDIDQEESARRVAARLHHYMPADLVPSQFRDLERPADALTIDGTLPVDAIVRTILTA